MKISSLFSVLLSTAALTLTLAAPAQAIVVQGTWQSTLLGRDINRNAVASNGASAFYLYDTTLKVTWLRNANKNALMTWDSATIWADTLSTGSGANAISDWRLPTMTDTGTSGCNFSYNGTDCGYNVATDTSEMASLFFYTLGNKSYRDTIGQFPTGFGLTNTGDFQNMQSYFYWSGLEYAPATIGAWMFDAANGYQDAYRKDGNFFAMAVRRGDVLAATVPEPQSLLLALTALACLGLVRRRRAVGSLAL
jgi:hypothetical protein